MSVSRGLTSTVWPVWDCTGDPGSLSPPQLFSLLDQLAKTLHQFHPKATVWVSNQGFTQSQMSQFYAILATPQANSVYGIVYGPHARDTLTTTRAKVPAKYPIRLYPDLGHGLKSMYPNPLWPVVYAATEALNSQFSHLSMSLTLF